MKKIILASSLLLIMASACSKKTAETASSTDTAPAVSEYAPGTVRPGVAVGYRDSKPRNAMPKATAFRISGDYAGHVAITLSPGGQLQYFPDPSDITPNSRPVDLGNGWWLNTQGISASSVFTTYTFDEYAKLKSVPSPDKLKAAVIPGARVTEMQQLPFSVSEARQNLDSIKSYLAAPKMILRTE